MKSDNLAPIKNRRKLANIVGDVRVLFKASTPFLVLILTNMFVISFANWELSQLAKEPGSANPEVVALQLKVSSYVIIPIAAALFSSSLIALTIWVFISHRIFGPIIPIQRHIENLTKGDYDSVVQLRPNDEFKEVAKNLNRLAGVLKHSRH